MRKRTDTIKSLFAAQAATPLSADNALTAPPRVTAGSVRSVRDTFSEVEKENEALRKQMETGARVVEIDPALIDPSPLSDRLREDADLSFNRSSDQSRTADRKCRSCCDLTPKRPAGIKAPMAIAASAPPRNLGFWSRPPSGNSRMKILWWHRASKTLRAKT